MFDIIQFVREHRLAYKHSYMRPTLRAREGETMRLEACHNDDLEHEHFRDHEIVVSFEPPKDELLWAANVIQKRDEKVVGYVYVNPELADKDKDLKKFCLAEEWLEVMVGFADLARRESRRAVRGRGKVELIELFNSMGKRALWQDTDEDLQQIQVGLQHLLVSEDTIRDTIEKSYRMPMDEFRQLARDRDRANEARRLISSVERSIAAERFVRLDLVELRMDEVLYDLPSS